MWLHYIVRTFFNLLLFVLGGRLRVSGLHNLPTGGPYLLVANHMSIADSPVVLMALPPIRTHFWIGEKWRALPVFGYLAGQMGGIFINRQAFDRQALRAALTELAAGEIVGLAPEATRSTIGQIIRPRHGAAFLAIEANVPIVPVALIGTEHLFANFARLRTTPIEARIGAPFMLPPLPGRRIRQRELEAYSDLIMLHIAALLPARYHGYYRHIQHPGLPAILAGADPWPDCLALATAHATRQPT